MKIAITIALLLGVTGVARAQPAATFKAGVAAYQSGDYATAIVAFEEAFRLDPLPETAFTLAQAHRNQYFVDGEPRHLQRALGLYSHYLAESPTGRRAVHARLHLESITAILASLPERAPAPTKPPSTQLLITAEVPGARASVDGDPAQRVPRLAEVTPGAHTVRVEADHHDATSIEALAIAERLVLVPANLRARPARLEVRTTKEAHVEIDGRATTRDELLPAGEHVLTLRARGRVSVVRVVELAAGDARVVDITLVPTRRRRVARGILIGGAALAATSLLAGTTAWFAQRDAVDRMPPRGTDIAAYNAAVDRRDRWRAVAVGSGSLAAAATLGGLALYWFDMPARAERPRVVPQLGPESIGAGVVTRF